MSGSYIGEKTEVPVENHIPEVKDKHPHVIS